ncbi:MULTISPECIES: hypothetical protein [Rhodomicrobium]|uniref:hypothetical protein n=1 Tax=Rhodomicrobium TaxID=1068 RepID=UPI000F7468A4|nr:MULTISPECIES: hypothetical protein [Rhodomicrobium]
MKRFKALAAGALAVIALATGGGAAAATKPKAVPASGKKMICVLSDVAHEFYLQKIGLTVFGNEFSTVAVPQWQLDQAIFNKAKAILSAKFDVKHVPTKIETYAPLRTEGGFFRDREGERKALIQKLTASSGCDYILLVAGNASQVGSTNQYVGGLGVLEMGNELMGYSRQVHALTFLYVYDGRSMETLQYQRGGTDEDTLFKAIHGPSQEIDVKLHPTLQAVADDPKTRDLIRKQVERSLELTVPGLFDIKALDQAANINVQTAKDRAAKKDHWAPF